MRVRNQHPSVGELRKRTFVRRHLRGIVGLAIVSGVILLGAAAPIIAPIDPRAANVSEKLTPPSWLADETVRSGAESETGHFLGTDQLGRDILKRGLHGSRVSLLIGLTTVLISGLVGVSLGLASGYFGGKLDQLMIWLCDVQMSFPFLVLAIAMMVALGGQSLVNVIGVLAITGWVTYFRVVRAETIKLRGREFIEAARAIGCSHWRIALRHILPNAIPACLVLATYQVAQMIIAESSLSFLGMGVPSHIPTWGAMIADGRQYAGSAWWVSTFPGLMLVTTVLGIGFVGDWVRDIIDPTLKIT